MRRLVGALACLATLSLMSASICIADTATPTGGSFSQTTNPQSNWLSLKVQDTKPLVVSNDTQAIDPQKDGPVLLPLPPEGWACVLLLTSMVCFRGLKRARVI